MFYPIVTVSFVGKKIKITTNNQQPLKNI